jgi:hypothetical protein
MRSTGCASGFGLRFVDAGLRRLPLRCFPLGPPAITPLVVDGVSVGSAFADVNRTRVQRSDAGAF